MLKRRFGWFQNLRLFFEAKAVLPSTPLILKVIFSELALWCDQGNWLGALWQKPNFWSQIGYLIGLKNQVNNLGNVYHIAKKNRSFIQEIEFGVIETLKKQLHAGSSVEGYCTSGGTEANLFLMWLGRNWLKTQKVLNPLVLVTDLTHYSVTKAARITGLDYYKVALDEDTLTLSASALTEKLDNLYRIGQRGCVLILTWGYSSTGGCDDWAVIEPVLQNFTEKHSDFYFFVWIDASAQGLPLTFLSKSHACPFNSSFIKGYVLDYHKLGLTPLQTGVVLYKSELADLIKTAIPYLTESDVTISGSRSGAVAMSIWLGHQSKSDVEWLEYYQKLIVAKNLWLTNLATKYSGIKIFTHPFSLTAGIEINENFPSLSKTKEQLYALNKVMLSLKIAKHLKLADKSFNHYKIHFLTENLPLF